MTEKYNPTKDLRFRKRSSSTVSPDWEVLQAVVGFAFTIQQEYLRLRRDTSAMLSAIAQQQTASVEKGYPAALQRIVASAHNLTEASGAAIALGNEQGMICVARSGASSPPLGSRFDARSGLSGECIRTRESVICMNAAADPRVDYGACTALGIKSMVYRPLLAKGQLIGVLAVFSSRPQHFSHRDLNCLRWTDELISDAIGGHESKFGVGLLIREVLGPEEALPLAASPALSKDPGTTVASKAALPKTIDAPLADPKLLNGGNATLGMLDVVKEAAQPKPGLPVAPPKPAVIQEAAPPRPAPTFVGRVVDESVAADELPSFDRKEEPYESPVPMLVAAIMVLAFLVVVGLMSYMRIGPKATPKPAPALEQQQPQPASVSVTPQATPEAAPAQSANTEAQPSSATEEPMSSAKPETELPQNMEFRSEPGKSTLNILLNQPITYQGFAIKSPDRLYFDVNGVNLVGSKGASVAVQSQLVSRIRIWQRSDTTARIVFDLHQAVDYYAVQSVKPQRLSIELHPKSTSVAIPAPPVAPAVESASAGTVTIVIDPGHGGHDNGAISASGLQEKDVTLDLAQRLGSLLEKRLGAKVVYTRTKDEFVSLADRVTMANNSHADLMISIHGNSSTYRSVRGLETYYFKNSQEALSLAATSTELKQSDSEADAARSFAADVHRALLHGLNDGDQTRNRGLKTAPFVVLRDARMPAVLAEVAFISSRKDAKRLESSSYRDKVAKALYQGIANHVSRRDTRILAASELLHNTSTLAAR